MELGFDFGYDRQIYGSDRENKIVDRVYSGSLAWYIFSTTAIEINYSLDQQITTQNTDVAIQGSTLTMTESQNRVETEVYGIGIRQGLLPPSFRLRPMISIGYARQFVKDTTDYSFKNSANGQEISFSDGPYKRRDDSVFAGFILQWQLTKMLAIKGSVRTVFPAFQYNSARDNLKYLVGFSWFF